MENITVGSRVRLVNLNLTLTPSEGKKFHPTPYNTVGNIGNVSKIEGLWVHVKWDNGTGNCYLLHNLEIIKEEKERPRDVYTIALNSLEEAGIKVSRQTLKCVAYHVVFGELLFEVMRKEKLDLQTTGTIIAALNKAIIGD